MFYLAHASRDVIINIFGNVLSIGESNYYPSPRLSMQLEMHATVHIAIFEFMQNPCIARKN